MAFIEVTNPGVINAGSESSVRPIVSSPPFIPHAGPGTPIPTPKQPPATPAALPVTTNPDQSQLVTGVPVNVNIK